MHNLAPISYPEGTSRETIAGLATLTIESLASAANDRDRARQHLKDANRVLHDEIRQAVKWGIPVAQVARLSGIARQNVYAILKAQSHSAPNHLQ